MVELLLGLTTDCARLLDVAAAGLLLADEHGALHLVAASSEEATTLDLLQLQRAEGPCLHCFKTGAPVSVPDPSKESHRWPHFAAGAVTAGFASVHAVPLRLRTHVLGALNLFGPTVGRLSDQDHALAQALAHVASVALVQEKAAADKDLIVTQLNVALTSRVVLEQAKGILANHGTVEMADAFNALRGYARSHNERLSDVAARVVSRALLPATVLGRLTAEKPSPATPSRRH